jgi:hypothetical protein|tara:strand:+ start:39 stop:707 length:669 start_codon:yes stop_codon:yes gene_type:complete
MNIKVLFILIVLVFLVNNYYVEKFDELVVSSKDVDNLNIEISIDKVNELFNLLNYIKFSENKPKMLENLPEELQNNDIYNNILYEMYIEDFLDNYLVNRFDINQYIKVTYKYTDYYDKLYDRIDLMKKNIDNLDRFIFIENSDNIIIDINNKMKDIEVNEFSDFFKNEMKSYFDKVFINLGLNDFFIYELKELNNDNIVEIMDIIDNVIENEFNIFNNYLEN